MATGKKKGDPKGADTLKKWGPGPVIDAGIIASAQRVNEEARKSRQPAGAR